MLISIPLSTNSFISLSRYVGNINEIQEYLDSLTTDNSKVQRWVQSNLKKYIIQNYENVTEYRLKKQDSASLHRAYNDGNTVFKVLLTREFKIDIEHALAFLSTVTNPLNVPVEEAIRQGQLMIDRSNKKATTEEDAQGITVLHSWENGFRMVSMTSKTSLS
jgi:hypothetical protein